MSVSTAAAHMRTPDIQPGTGFALGAPQQFQLLVGALRPAPASASASA